MSKEVMKLALEALKQIDEAMPFPVAKLAQAALREALAKPDFWEGYVPEPVKPAQQEPVATLWQHGETGRTRITMPDDITDCDARWFKAADLYTSPPAQRTWVGLTDEERKLVRNSVGYNQFVTAGEYAEHVQKATEFKLLEKNT